LSVQSSLPKAYNLRFNK